MISDKNISEQYIEETMLAIDSLLQKGAVDGAYLQYTALIDNMEQQDSLITEPIRASVYAQFAYFLFSASEYEHFFRMLVRAQDCGYSREEIEQVLFQAFIEPNIDEFKANYEANINLLRANVRLAGATDFNDLPFWLLPTGVANEYYMYDKRQKLLSEKIRLHPAADMQLPVPADAFSDFLLLESWEWSSLFARINAIKKLRKNTYVVFNQFGKFLSCLQGTRLKDDMVANVFLFESLTALSEHLCSSGTFLPRNVIDLIGHADQAKELLDRIHAMRIRPEHRNGDRVLISVCIPSYNRGKRAYDNILQLLKSYYDEEIEFVLSNNGTQNETSMFYDQIKQLSDARVHYFAFEENQGFAINLCQVCDLAKGQFILLLSDEDLLNFDTLHHVMNMLVNRADLPAIIRTSTTNQSKPPSKEALPGKDALLTFMLTSNYMSGIIFNAKFLKQQEATRYVRENLSNSVCYYYPHMYFELLLCQYGRVLGTHLLLVHEGKAEKTEVPETELAGTNQKIPYYASIEGRLEQHEGFFTIIRNLDACKGNYELFREMYIKLCQKTMYLTTLSIRVFYKKTNDNSAELLDRVYHFCILDRFLRGHSNSNRNSYRHDVQVLNQYRSYIAGRI